MSAGSKFAYITIGLVCGVCITVVVFVIWALWSGNTETEIVENRQDQESVNDGTTLKFNEALYSSGMNVEMCDRLTDLSLVEERPASLKPYPLIEAAKPLDYAMVPEEYSVAGGRSHGLKSFYTAHLGTCGPELLHSLDMRPEVYQVLALGKLQRIRDSYEVTIGKLDWWKKKYPGADFSATDSVTNEGIKRINEAIALYNAGKFEEADIAAFAGRGMDVFA